MSGKPLIRGRSSRIYLANEGEDNKDQPGSSNEAKITGSSNGNDETLSYSLFHKEDSRIKIVDNSSNPIIAGGPLSLLELAQSTSRRGSANRFDRVRAFSQDDNLDTSNGAANAATAAAAANAAIYRPITSDGTMTTPSGNNMDVLDTSNHSSTRDIFLNNNNNNNHPPPFLTNNNNNTNSNTNSSTYLRISNAGMLLPSSSSTMTNLTAVSSSTFALSPRQPPTVAAALLPSTATAAATSAISTTAAPTIVDPDWYGNTILHQFFGHRASCTEEIPDYAAKKAQIVQLLSEQPSLAMQANQFHRLPLHYALDRSIIIDEEMIKLLVSYAPQSVNYPDDHAVTPYQLASRSRWHHRKAIRLLLLEAMPSMDEKEYLTLKYGRLAGSLAHSLRRFSSSSAAATSSLAADQQQQQLQGGYHYRPSSNHSSHSHSHLSENGQNNNSSAAAICHSTAESQDGDNEHDQDDEEEEDDDSGHEEETGDDDRQLVQDDRYDHTYHSNEDDEENSGGRGENHQQHKGSNVNNNSNHPLVADSSGEHTRQRQQQHQQEADDDLTPLMDSQPGSIARTIEHP